MKVRELIEELKEHDLDMEVCCSVDCDTDDDDMDVRRVFGVDCMGTNPYPGQVFLLFRLDEATHDVKAGLVKSARKKKRKRKA